MIRTIKAIIKKIISFTACIVFKTKVGKVVSESFIKLSMNDTKEINYKGFKFKFITPNSINRFRIDTFATKEPETLEWIDSFKKNTVFWCFWWAWISSIRLSEDWPVPCRLT